MKLTHVLGAALMMAVLQGPSVARAAVTGPETLGPVPQDCGAAGLDFTDPTCTTQTRLGTFSLSPHVVHAGHELTGTVALNGNFPISWPDTQASPSLGFNPGLTAVSGCKSTSTTCVWKISKDAPTQQYTILTVGITNEQGTGISKDYYAIIGKDQFELAGHIKDDNGKAVSGVRVHITGPEHTTVTTDATGLYNAVLKRGTYSVAPSRGKDIFSPESASTSLIQDRTVDFKLIPDIHQITITPDTNTLPTSGYGVDGLTITDKDAHGDPVTNQTIKIEPPLTYEIPALLCDSSNRLVYPTKFSDGSLFGGSFQRITDGAGQIHLTGFFGTVPGEWLIEAGEPDMPLRQYGALFVNVTDNGGPTQLPGALTSLLIAAGNSTLGNFNQSAQRNVLSWLGQVQDQIGGVGFVPIHSTDAAGSPQAGVVVFANSADVRNQLFSYLDGKSNTPPSDLQAVVIDIANLKQLLLGTRLAGQLVNNVPYRLPSLSEWANGTVIQIASADVQAFGNTTHIPVPARGRPLAGLLAPQRNEDLIYSYGPYPPFKADAATQAMFNQCVAPMFATTVTAHSPVSVTVRDPQGRSAGVDTSGRAIADVPGAIVHYQGHTVKTIQVPSGSYRLDVTGTGNGPATLVVNAGRPDGGVAAQVFHFRARRGAHGTISFSGGSISSTLRFGGRRIAATHGLRLSVRGLPRRLRHGHRARLTLTVRDEFGGPAGAVGLNVRGPAGKWTALTDGHGRAALTLRPRTRGRVTLTLAGPGYAPLTVSVSVS